MDRLKILITSKTVLIGILSIAYGVYEITQGGEGLEKIGYGLSLIFVRDAIAKK